MKNSFGNALNITIFGESHGKSVGLVLDGLPAGIPINTEYINKCLDLRKPKKDIGTSRKEADELFIESGVKNGFSTGSSILLRIENKDVRGSDYSQFEDIPRPGHTDYVSSVKYNGFADLNGGGHFSGRLTAPIAALGGIILPALKRKGILIGSHILSIKAVKESKFSENTNTLKEQIENLEDKAFAVINSSAKEKMENEMKKAKENGNSVGGIIETAVLGMPRGAGEPWFDSIESTVSHALFSVPAVKGIQFGKGFDFANILGSEANDCFTLNSQNEVVTATNNNGGINGGISNGMPIVFSVVLKPTPTISYPQKTLNLKTKKEETLICKGRHDPSIVPRANIVIKSLTAFCIADILTLKYGTDWMAL